MKMARKPKKDHWLVRPESIRLIWIVSLTVLALTVLADLFISHHPHFGIDGTIGFAAWFGFVACVVLIVVAKSLGAILKRSDTYYDR